MKIDVRETSGVVVVEPKGKVTIAGGDVALRQQVEQLLDMGHKRILVGLGDVKAMDSSGLGELIACKGACEERGAQIRLLDVSQKVGKILTMTRLVGIFEIMENEADAIASFGS